MVYRKGTLKVLLGPEHLQGEEDAGDNDSHDSHVTPIRPQQRRHIEPAQTFGKIGETHVYKRTRPLQSAAAQPRPRLDRYPSGLELSGQKVEKDENQTKSARSVRSSITTKSGARPREPETQTTDTGKSENMENNKQGKDTDGQSNKPSLNKPKTGIKSANNTVSNYFLSDFGFRSERTDTFSGHHRHRTIASIDLERQMEEKAEKHIRTCQLMGNVKRSCKAQQGYEGLRHAVSPRRPTHAFFSPEPRPSGGMSHRDFHRSADNLNKDNSVPYMIQIRKSLGSISKTRSISQNYQRPDPLPAITCRTLMVGSGLGV